MTHTILIVEDETELREMMKDALELSGYEVVAAADGEAALEELPRIRQLCLVLLDLVMPRMTGWEFMDRVRGTKQLENVPVVVHSSAPDAAIDGVKRILRKPINLDQLMAVVQEYCAH